MKKLKRVTSATKVTTYVFTATMLPISSSAGITAAAGTRLALNLLLETVFKGFPFQSTTLAVVATDSQLFKLCLFEKFSLLLPTLAVNAVSNAFSPESNPNSPLSVKATVVQYTTVHS